MMDGRKSTLACGIAALFSVVLCRADVSAQEAIRIGTSSVGSNFYALAVGVGEVVHKHAKINTTVEAVGGSSANVRGLGAKNIEFAIANAFAAFTGFQGTYNFKGKKIDIRLAIQGHTNNRWFVVRKRANIRRISDLKGRTVIAKRRALPEQALIMDSFMKEFGFKKGDINVVATTNTGQVFKALAAGSVDAAIIPFSARAANVQKPLTEGLIDFLYLSSGERDRILKNLPPMLFADDWDRTAFQGMRKPLHVIGLNTYFLTRPDVSADTVYKVTKAIFENTKELATYRRSGARWTVDNTLRHVALPFHDGVVRYFKEVGRWTPELEANQQKLRRR